MKGIYVPLDVLERDAIVQLAQTERRDPRQQAALLIRQRLESLGLLPTSQPQVTTSAQAGKR